MATGQNLHLVLPWWTSFTFFNSLTFALATFSRTSISDLLWRVKWGVRLKYRVIVLQHIAQFYTEN
jgi:hypothetical protein